jgi:hypothetical protein
MGWSLESLANSLGAGAGWVFLLRLMGHSKGKDNVKKRAARRKKTDRLQAVTDAAKKTP